MAATMIPETDARQADGLYAGSISLEPAEDVRDTSRDTSADEAEWRALESAPDAPERMPCRAGERHDFADADSLMAYLDDAGSHENKRLQAARNADFQRRGDWLDALRKWERSRAKSKGPRPEKPADLTNPADYQTVVATIAELARVRVYSRTVLFTHWCVNCGRIIAVKPAASGNEWATRNRATSKRITRTDTKTYQTRPLQVRPATLRSVNRAHPELAPLNVQVLAHLAPASTVDHDFAFLTCEQARDLIRARRNTY